MVQPRISGHQAAQEAAAAGNTLNTPVVNNNSNEGVSQRNNSNQKRQISYFPEIYSLATV